MKTKLLYSSRTNWNSLYIYCAIALILGGIIYRLFRPQKPIFFDWIGFTGFYGLIGSFRQNSLYLAPHLPDWVIYSLPDGLWAFAYALIITRIWMNSPSGFKYFWLASIPILVLGFEILQYSGIIPGTFCYLDLIVGFIGLIAGIVLGNKTIKQKTYENELE